MMIRRRHMIAGLAAGCVTGGAAPAPAGDWHGFNITGVSPALSLRMQTTPDGRDVTQDDFRGSLVMLYLGYTSCPDACPLVMQNMATAFSQMGALSNQVRFLFVTVDPGRDSLKALGDYTAAFGPQFTGLRGDTNGLERIARRYRLAYSVTPADDPRAYEVSHSDAVYVFDRQLNARLLLPSIATADADIDGVAADLTRLAAEPPSRWGWLRGLV
jgi:protein SCO1/2